MVKRTVDGLADKADRLCGMVAALRLVNDAAGGPLAGSPEVQFVSYRARLAMIEVLAGEVQDLRDALDQLEAAL